MTSDTAIIIGGIVVGALVFATVRLLSKPVVQRSKGAAPAKPKRPMTFETPAPPPAPPTPAPAGSHLLVLRDCGPNKIMVIKALRTAIPGLDLARAKAMSEQTPTVLEGLTLAGAQALLQELREQGATVDSAVDPGFPAMPESHPPAVAGGRYRVMLQVRGPNKIMVIKIVREVTGLGLAEAKHLVESAPIEVAQLDAEAAQHVVRQLESIGARATWEMV